MSVVVSFYCVFSASFYLHNIIKCQNYYLVLKSVVKLLLHSIYIFFTSTDAQNPTSPFTIFRLIRCEDHELSMQQRKGDHQLSDINPNY